VITGTVGQKLQKPCDVGTTSSGPNRRVVTARSNNLRVGDATVKKWSPRVRLFPVIFFITYLNFTVFLFAFGPWPYPVVNGTKLYVFLAFAHLALLAGYLSAAFRKPGGYYGRWSVQRLVTLSLVVNLLLFFPTSAFLTGRTIPDVWGAFANLGAAYARSRFIREEGTPIIMYLRMFAGPFLAMSLPLTIFYWKKLKPTIRKWAVVAILGEVAMYIAMGTNAGVARFALVVPWLLLAGHFSGVQRLNWLRKSRFLVGSIILLVLFFMFFSSAISTRGSSLSAHYSPAIGKYADVDNFMVRYLPPSVQDGVLSLTSYVTHGYYALYLSLDEPFMPMFGVGNSLFLFRQAARITGIKEIMNWPYPVRIEKYGWDAYGLWSTIYPWIASDVSFPGTILVVFLVGRLFALSWLDTLKGNNPFAIAIFAMLLMILFYFPATNQWLQGGEGLVAFWGILALWLFTRRKYMWGQKRII